MKSVRFPTKGLATPAQRSAAILFFLGFATLVAQGSCKSEEKDPPPSTPEETTKETHGFEWIDNTQPPAWVYGGPIIVGVLLVGEPHANALVLQGGSPEHQLTDERGFAVLNLDGHVTGQPVIFASSPEARIRSVTVPPDHDGSPLRIELSRFATRDNLAYFFQDPGEPERIPTTSQCGHCHRAIVQSWYDSPHRTAASNPIVQDLYSGTVSGAKTEEDCHSIGGRWMEGIAPETTERSLRCYLGVGVLPSLNPNCGDDQSCDGIAETTGECADCHAPGIDGQLGGRDLLEASSRAYTYGVHCDVCHKVESVVLTAEAGVAGRLAILRPTEDITGSLGPWAPLTFAPRHDVSNPRMGAVQRSHFQDGTICAGCHQLDQAVLVPGAAIDTVRWPTGRLPIHSTFDEWLRGPLSEAAPCNSCHMPPNPMASNSAEIADQVFPTEDTTNGFFRPAGNVRFHSWVGPRQPESRMLQLAAAIFIEKETGDNQLTAHVTVKNVGPGHAIPTGEPMRSLLLLVTASCNGEPLDAIGGDVVPDFGDWLDRKESGEDWSHWAGASPGDVVRVIRQTEQWYDYHGYGPFGDGRFSPAQKGMPRQEVVGQATIASVDGDAVTFSQELPVGDIAYRADSRDLPEHNASGGAWAGAPGFGFARVLIGPDEQRMVPHFLAVDVASDNRLLPQESWTSTHIFESNCADPQVHARLIHRAWPLKLARERGWELTESLMVEAQR